MSPVRLFTLAGAKQSDPDVECWFADKPAGIQSIARKWFGEMRSVGPDVYELLHDGHPTTCVADLALGYVNAFSNYINVGFYFGAVLRDPTHLLRGSGKYMRHVKVFLGEYSSDMELRQLMRDAYADITARLAERS